MYNEHKFLILMIVCLIFTTNCDNKNQSNFKLNLDNEQKEKLNAHFINEDEYKVQDLKIRNFIKIPQKINRINLSDINIYQPWLFKCYKDDIYFLDYSSNLITKVSINNINDRITFGKGKGRGPGELIQPWDFDFFQDKIYILAGAKNTIEVYSTYGDFIKTISIENLNPYRIFINKKNKSIVVRNESDFVNYFYEYDLDGKFLSKFGGPLVNKNLQSILYHDGDFIRYSDSNFYYTSRYLGIVGFYKNNKLQFIKNTIDKIQNPHILGNPGTEHLDNEKIFAPLNNSDSNAKYIAIQSKNNSTKEIFLDFYEKTNLKYLFSIDLNKEYSFRLLNNYLIVFDFNNHELEIYNIRI